MTGEQQKGLAKRWQKPEESSGCEFRTNEGVADQFGFESCADSRDRVSEALTEERSGRPLSSALFASLADHSGVSTLS